MLSKRLLIAGTLSTLVLGTTTLLAQGSSSHCVGSVCFVNLDKIKPTKGFKKEKKPLVVFEKPRFVESKSEEPTHNELEDTIDKTIEIVVDNQEVYVFPSYVMTEEEKIAYFEEQKAIELNEKENLEANEDLRIVSKPIEKVEEKILEKTALPTSDYYCENNTHPVYNEELDFYECV